MFQLSDNVAEDLVFDRLDIHNSFSQSRESSVSSHGFLLQDDKKFYQLELVNRETNFNKVFNASPNVGVINPLIKVGPDVLWTHHTQGHSDELLYLTT